jgi:hypothetical protein
MGKEVSYEEAVALFLERRKEFRQELIRDLQNNHWCAIKFAATIKIWEHAHEGSLDIPKEDALKMVAMCYEGWCACLGKRYEAALKAVDNKEELN